MTGTIQSEIGLLRKFAGLDSNLNKKEGTIPTKCSKLDALAGVSLNTNYLTKKSALTMPTSNFSRSTLSYLRHSDTASTTHNNCLSPIMAQQYSQQHIANSILVLPLKPTSIPPSDSSRVPT